MGLSHAVSSFTSALVTQDDFVLRASSLKCIFVDWYHQM